MMERDDFEFKPLTEGLGFHKKVIDIKDDQSHLMMNTVAPSTTGIMPQPKNPQAQMPRPGPLGSRPPMQQNANTLARGWRPAMTGLDLIDQKAQPQRQATIMPIATSWAAGLFDSAMITGLSLIFSTVVFALTQMDLGDLVQMLLTEAGAQMAAVVLLIGVAEIYTVTCRTFFGKTLGEFAFELRLGAPHEQQSLIYPLQVAWRTFVVAVTGFIILPLLSSILKFDVAGKLSGVALYSDKK